MTQKQHKGKEIPTDEYMREHKMWKYDKSRHFKSGTPFQKLLLKSARLLANSKRRFGLPKTTNYSDKRVVRMLAQEKDKTIELLLKPFTR